MANTKGSEREKTGVKTNQHKPRAPRGKSAVEKAIGDFESSLDGKNVSLGDYLRLVQLQKEIDEDEPKDIECKWVEQGETKSSDK